MPPLVTFPVYGAKAIPEHFNCQLIFAMKSIPSPRQPVGGKVGRTVFR